MTVSSDVTFKSNPRGVYQRLKTRYDLYLQNYKQLNNGSEVGARSFRNFYILHTYYNKYCDNRAFILSGYGA